MPNSCRILPRCNWFRGHKAADPEAPPKVGVSCGEGPKSNEIKSVVANRRCLSPRAPLFRRHNAGSYHPPESLKTDLCIRGRRLHDYIGELHAKAQQHRIPPLPHSVVPTCLIDGRNGNHRSHFLTQSFEKVDVRLLYSCRPVSIQRVTDGRFKRIPPAMTSQNLTNPIPTVTRAFPAGPTPS